MPRELCLRAKKVPAVKAWVRALEEPVRKYLVELEVAKERPDEEEEEESEAEVEEEEDASISAERVIAVDWALSKDKWEEAKAKLQEEAEVKEEEVSAEEEGDGRDNETDSSEEDGNEDDGDSHIDVHDREDGESDEDDEMDVDDDDSKPGKPLLPQTDVGTTLFVRNVPFEATEDELRTTYVDPTQHFETYRIDCALYRFRAFGPLRYARITMDYESGRSRGTGFVCFWNKEDADKAIEQSQLLHDETTGGVAPAVSSTLAIIQCMISDTGYSQRRTHSSSRPYSRPIRQPLSPRTLSCTAGRSTLAEP